MREKVKSKVEKNSTKKKALQKGNKCRVCSCPDYVSDGTNKCKCGHSSQQHS